jgi:hypothetical protein
VQCRAGIHADVHGFDCREAHGRDLLELAFAGSTPDNMQIPQILGAGRIYGTSHQRARCDRLEDADPLGKGHKFHQGLDLYFLHHPVATRFDCTFGTA